MPSALQKLINRPAHINKHLYNYMSTWCISKTREPASSSCFRCMFGLTSCSQTPSEVISWAYIQAPFLYGLHSHRSRTVISTGDDLFSMPAVPSSSASFCCCSNKNNSSSSSILPISYTEARERSLSPINKPCCRPMYWEHGSIVIHRHIPRHIRSIVTRKRLTSNRNNSRRIQAIIQIQRSR
jgi:hypothetical protein